MVTQLEGPETDLLYAPEPELWTPDGVRGPDESGHDLWLPDSALDLLGEDGLLYEPPGLDLGEHDPPMEAWPGRMRDVTDVIKASGHVKDYFRFSHRWLSQEKWWIKFFQARDRRPIETYHTDFSWNQILIFGEYGGGKTTLANKVAYRYGELGHAVFSNTSTLIGWHLEGIQMFTSIPLMPYASVLIIDEGSAWLASRASGTVAVGAFIIASLNIRKKNILMIIVSAQDHNIAPGVRDYCVEAWRPLPVEVESSTPKPRGLPAHSDPDNFVSAWEIWLDYPYRRGDLVDEDGGRKNGFGPADRLMFDSGEAVRESMLVTATFELADVGAAFLQDRDEVRDDLQRQRDAKGDGTGAATIGYDAQEYQVLSSVLGYMRMSETAGEPYITPGFIANETGIPPAQVGRVVSKLFAGVKNEPRRGYSMEQIRPLMNDYQEGGDDNDD